MELQASVETLRQRGLGLAAISYDSRDVLADFTRRQGISFPLLSDPGSKTIKAYGLLNTTLDPTNSVYGIPFPGTFILDPQGVVKARFFEDAYQQRRTVSSILVRLGAETGTTATRLSTDHLDITTSVSDERVAPGNHISLVLDIAPEDRIHVYAPAASGYKPISLTLEPQPGVLLKPMQFPVAEDYFFAPLSEHVPVYQKPFRLIQEVTLDGSADGVKLFAQLEKITIKGRLDYQACDDKVCFNPESVLVSWTMTLRRLDTERVAPR